MKRTKALTAEQQVFNVTIGEAMAMFCDVATEKDWAIKRAIGEMLDKALENLPAGTTGQHLGMAVVDLARGLVYAQVRFRQEAESKGQQRVK